jgi:uncharacterized protein YecT (DUF1311 family)
LRRLAAARITAGLAVLAMLALGSGPAAAGALEECHQRTPTRLDVTPCLTAAKKIATDAMLEQFLAVSQSLEALEQATGRGGKLAQLKQSQRDFERYLQSHCQVVLRAIDSGGGAAQAQLACEVDLLRARAALLRPLAPNETKPRE